MRSGRTLKARLQYGTLTSGKTDPIPSAAPTCVWLAGPLGTGSAQRSVCCLPIWSCKAVTVSAQDWPLDYPDLATWYDVAELELGVSGHDDDIVGPPRQNPYPMPGLPATLGDRLMEQIAATFGFKVRVSPQARNSQPFDGRPACCASSSCIPICPVQAKYDATVHLRKAEAASARILSEFCCGASRCRS